MRRSLSVALPALGARAASVMAEGLDPRFDLRKSDWPVAGIRGAGPERASLGSPAWAEWVVAGDLASREITPGFAPMRSEGHATLPGLEAALESVWRVGHGVVGNPANGWSQYFDPLPSELAPK